MTIPVFKFAMRSSIKKNIKTDTFHVLFTNTINPLNYFTGGQPKFLRNVVLQAPIQLWMQSTVENVELNWTVVVDIGSLYLTNLHVPMERLFCKRTEDAWQSFIASEAFVWKPRANQKRSDKVVVSRSCFGRIKCCAVQLSRSWNYNFNT